MTKTLDWYDTTDVDIHDGVLAEIKRLVTNEGLPSDGISVNVLNVHPSEDGKVWYSRNINMQVSVTDPFDKRTTRGKLKYCPYSTSKFKFDEVSLFPLFDFLRNEKGYSYRKYN